MGVARKKMVLRTIRLTREIDDLLQENAREKGVSASAFINQLVKKFVEWDKPAERFGRVIFTSETFHSILMEVDDRKLEDLGNAVGSSTPKAIAVSLFKKLNLDTFLKTISLIGEYSGDYTSEIELKEGNCVITFRHHHGSKWSIYLESYISQFAKTAVGVVTDGDIVGDLVVLRFRVPQSKSRNKDNPLATHDTATRSTYTCKPPMQFFSAFTCTMYVYPVLTLLAS
nr:hypothetical protein [Candidatus Njordarchaeota archaeon]